MFECERSLRSNIIVCFTSRVVGRREKLWWCGALQPSLIPVRCLASPRLACSLQLLHKHENVTAASGSSAIFKTHFISLAPPPPLFFSVFLSFCFDSGKSWGEGLGVSNNYSFFVSVSEGGGKRTGLSVGRRQKRERSYIGWIKQGCNSLYHLEWLQ